MRIYAVASTASGGRPKHGLELSRYPNVLIPYSPPVKGRNVKWGYIPERLFLDSGAYVAWSRGQKIEVERYGDWASVMCEWHPQTVTSNLDIIAGRKGERATRKERQDAVREGIRNAEYLRSRGLAVIEVYHLGEPEEVLAGICDRSDGRLAVGGLVGGHDRAGKVAFCSRTFHYLESRYGRESFPRVHGFGVGPESKLGVGFPWASVDCSTWLSPQLYGSAIDGAGAILPRAGRVPDPMKASDSMLRRWLRLEGVTAEHWSRRGFRFA